MTRDAHPVEEQYSFTQAAQRLGVSRQTIWLLVKRGEIYPVRRWGHRTVRIPASAINRFLEAKTCTP
jgi:excisionase family DNA binding protein